MYELRKTKAVALSGQVQMHPEPLRSSIEDAKWQDQSLVVRALRIKTPGSASAAEDDD